MKRILLLAVLLFFTVACSSAPPMATATPTQPPTLPSTPSAPAVVQEFLAEALSFVQQYSYYRGQVDWEAAREWGMRMTRNDQVPADTYDVIAQILRNHVGDRHAYLIDPAAVAQYSGAGLQDNPQPTVTLILDRLGYIKLPMFASGDLNVVNEYAVRLQKNIRLLDASLPCGWVVDLRANSGGNMWAMLAGVGPVLGEGKLGSFDFGDGRTNDWIYSDGQIIDDTGTMVGLASPGVEMTRPDLPVAVLTGYNTLSSGEAVAVAFRGRADTRSFGQPTGGYATAIELFPLSDGGMLGITTALFADRNGKVYTGPIPPDESLSTSLGTAVGQDIFVPQPALDWLFLQPGCTNP